MAEKGPFVSKRGVLGRLGIKGLELRRHVAQIVLVRARSRETCLCLIMRDLGVTPSLMSERGVAALRSNPGEIIERLEMGRRVVETVPGELPFDLDHGIAELAQ